MKTLLTTILLLFTVSLVTAQSSPDSSLVAFFPFNGNAIDETGNGHNGTVNGGILTNDRFNLTEKAYTFPNLHNNIVLDNSTGLNLENGFTLNAWVKYKNINCGIVGKHNCWVVNGFYLGIDNGHYYFRLGNSVWSEIVTSETYVEDQWYMVTGVYDHATNTGKVYVNGVLKASGSVLYNNYSSAPITISEGSNGCPDGNMPGAIDEVKIYNRALSDAEILAEYNSSSTGLIAYFPFNGNAIDETGNGYDGTINGNAALVPDRFGSQNKAFTFPDQSSSISLANSSNLNLETGFTLNAWIKYKTSGYAKVIVCKHTCGFVNGFFFGIDTDGQIALWIGQNGWAQVKTNDTFIEDQWYMVTATYDVSSGYAKIYVNGQLSSYLITPYYNFSSNSISIGESYQNNCSPGNMDGAVDEVKIYNRSLSDAEIQDEYNNTYNDLVLFLPFNGNADDESGSGNNGTVNGASLTQDRFGLNNKAYYLDGTDDFISIADNPNLFSDELTVSWWYKMSDLIGGRVVIGWVDGGHRYQQFFSNDQLSYFNGYNVNQGGMYFNPIYTLTDINVWKNVVVTYKKLTETTSTTSIYVDGELKQTDNHTLAMDYASGPDFFIGKNHNGNFFKGSLDDFRIFNRILNDTEILGLYQDSTTYFPPLENGLVAYWPMNGNTNDSTFNNNDGINHNGVFNKDRYASDLSSIYFDGVDSYVEGINPGNNLPTGNSPRTFSAWIKNNQYNQYGSNIFHYGTAQAAPTNFHFLITDVLGLGNGYGFGVVYGNTILNDSTWHFVTGVYEGGTERITKLYIDGKLDNSGAITSEPNTVLTTSWKVGRFMEGSSNFNGNIDELKVYDIPLTGQQIWDKYKATTTAPNLLFPSNDSTLINPPFPGLVLDWDSTVTANEYRLLIANDSSFNTIVHDTLLSTSSFDFYDWPFVDIDNLYWKIRTINDGGIGPWSEINRFQIVLTDVEDETQLPTEFALLQNYPNPFNPSTTITYHLPKTSNVELKVYDIIGNEIATLVNEEKAAGIYNVQATMNNLSSGIYFYKITAGDFAQTRKMILIK